MKDIDIKDLLKSIDDNTSAIRGWAAFFGIIQIIEIVLFIIGIVG